MPPESIAAFPSELDTVQQPDRIPDDGSVLGQHIGGGLIVHSPRLHLALR
jgi:hypothetical protein